MRAGKEEGRWGRINYDCMYREQQTGGEGDEEGRRVDTKIRSKDQVVHTLSTHYSYDQFRVITDQRRKLLKP